MAGFRGIDPQGLIGLADCAERCGRRLAATRRDTSSVLQRRGISDPAIDGMLARAEHNLSVRALELRRRATVATSAQDVSADTPGLEIMLGQLAASAILDLDSWEVDFEAWRLQAMVAYLDGLAAGDRPATFRKLTAADRMALTARFPEEIGAMDGAPSRLRYEANRVLIRREIERLDRLIALGTVTGSEIVRVLLGALRRRAAEYRRWLAESRQILLFDPNGDGRVVEVFGDLDEAVRIAVVIPGIANSIDNFSEGDGGFRGNAADLYEAVDGVGVATVAWLGYDTPDSLGAVSREAAVAGAPCLRSFLEGIDAGNDRAITVIAHSYGSVLVGTAAGGGIEANDLVFVGSPGTTLERAGDAVLRPGGHVWVALAEGDPIVLGVDPAELPWWLPPAAWPMWVGGDLWLDGAEELWHGVNPAGEAFGALRVTTEGSTGHSAYFEAGSLENLARIVSGRYADVELVE